MNFGRRVGKLLTADALLLMVTYSGTSESTSPAPSPLRSAAIPSVNQMGERRGENQAFLFGQRTYEELLASWNAQGGPFKEALNNTQKCVASRSSAIRLEWPDSTLLHGDIPAAVPSSSRHRAATSRSSPSHVTTWV